MGIFDGILSAVTQPVASIASSLIGGAFSASGQQSANEQNLQIAQGAEQFNAQQAQQQMDFQERMSDTAYQRATADMKAAGLNPMLAYQQGGASSPSGAAGSAVMPAPMQNVRAAGLQGASQAATVAATQASTQKLEAETDNTRADTLAKLELPSRIRQEVATSVANAMHLNASSDILRRELSADLPGRRANLMASQESAADAEAANRRAELPGLKARSSILGLDVPRAQREAQFYGSTAGKFAPYAAHSAATVAGGLSDFGKWWGDNVAPDDSWSGR